MPPPARPTLSRSVEDYLKAIYGLSERGEPASTSAIAEALAVQPASVTGMVERMAAALQFPSHDPHGAPIPTSAGEIEETDSVTLAEARSGVDLRVRAVRDEDPTRLRSIEAKGLTPGARLRVEDAPATSDQVSVRVG